MLPASAQITNTATIAGWCRSLTLEIGSVTPGGDSQAAFSTYDGVANSFLVDSRYSPPIVSDELRARAGVPGAYETDYGLFRQSVGFFEYGSLVLRLRGST